MLEFLSYAFVRRGLLAAVAVGSACSLLGVFVVLRGMSYLGTGIAHGCLAGAALGLLLGWDPTLTSLVAALAMVVLVEYLGRRPDIRMDAAIGVVFSLALALAVLFIGGLRGYTPAVMSYLFGNLLAVDRGQLLFVGGAALIVFLVVILLFKELEFATFAPAAAEAAGIPTRGLSFLLTLLMGMTIVLALRAVGELLVVALIVLPASTAREFARSPAGMAALSVLLGVMAAVVGLVLAFFLDAPSGATIVLVLAASFFVALFAGDGRKRG